MKNIQTDRADLKLVQKFLDYANVADAAYALLEYIHKNAENERQKNKADNLNFGDKLKQDTEVRDDKGNLLYTKPKGTNTAYACAIEARFMQDKIVGKEGNWCFPFTDICLTSKDTTINNDISKVGLNDTLSQRTIDFVNRYELLEHEPNQGKFLDEVIS